MESKNIIKSYEAPVVVIVEVQVEKGFAASSEGWEEQEGLG